MTIITNINNPNKDILERNICDGFGCQLTDITKTHVSAGVRTLTLYLCKKCINKVIGDNNE